MKNLTKIYWGAFIGTIVIVVGIYAIWGNKGTNTSSWIPIGDEGAGFMISFPREPEHGSQDIPIPDSTDVILQDSYTLIGDDEMRYLFIRSLQPVSLDGEEPQAVLQSALDGMLQTSPSNALQNFQPVEISGRPALKFSIVNSSNNTFFEGIITYKDKALYQAFVSYDESKKNETNLTAFLESLGMY